MTENNGRAAIGLVILVTLVILVISPANAQSDWQDAADEHAEQIEEQTETGEGDNPAWEQYAFTLDGISFDGELSFVDLARDEIPFVIFFWITDCPLCHLQLPQVQLI